MGTALEAGPQRLLDHLRRPLPGRRDLLTNNAGPTVSETVPAVPGDGAGGDFGRRYSGACDTGGGDPVPAVCWSSGGLRGDGRRVADRRAGLVGQSFGARLGG